MDNYSIAFITCVNDEELYEECIRYIENLNIPDDYKIEKIAIRDAISATSGYNKAMLQSNSKYKVYLHQDTFIINKNFISECLKIFDENENVGMMGVVGSETIPTSGVWWESLHKSGKVYESSTGKIALLDFDNNKNKEEYIEVQAIDGLIMITQYDVKWRDDIFDGWHFYDISQSTEFRKTGYKVVVPAQEQPWCVHDSGVANIQNGYEQYRKKFLDIYSKDIFPLVSILIPTHNRPEYFKIALDSAVNQTYKNIEIIVCDDSDDEKTKEIIQPYLKRYHNIVYDFDKGLDGVENWKKTLKLSKGEYINMLMDDDIFEIEKISKMINYYLEYSNISVVTSYRQVIDKDGNDLPPLSATSKLFEKDTIVDGKTLGKYVLSNMINVIGEPTTVLYKREYYNNFHINCNNNIVIRNADIARSLMALEEGDCVYISSALSKFRIHEDQAQFDNDIAKTGLIEWYNIIVGYWMKNLFFCCEDEFKVGLAKWMRETVNNLSRFSNNDKYKHEINEMLNHAIKLYLNIDR